MKTHRTLTTLIAVPLLIFLSTSVAFAEKNTESTRKIEYSIQLLEDDVATQPAIYQSWQSGRTVYFQSTTGENPHKGTPEQKVTFKATPTLEGTTLRLTGTLAGKSGDNQGVFVDIDQVLASGKAISIPLQINGVEYKILFKVTYPQS